MPGPKPRHLRALSGTLRPCRDGGPEAPPLPAVAELPPAPDWLPNAHATAEYRRLGCALLAHNILHEGNVGALAMLAAAHGALVQTMRAGLPLPAALLGQYRALARDLGLLQLVREPNATTKQNRFAHYGRRPESTT